MAVYVDTMRAQYRRMVMCHMVADSDAELHAMADRIGVARQWHQKAGTIYSHYDICLSKRALAVQAGAIEISWRELGQMLHDRRKQHARSQEVPAPGRPVAEEARTTERGGQGLRVRRARVRPHNV